MKNLTGTQKVREYRVNKLTELTNKLGKELNNPEKLDIDQLVAEINKAEKELYNFDLKAKIKTLNNREAKRRETLLQVVKLGPIKSELITSDNKLHKSKRKGNEDLYSFADANPYLSFRSDYNKQICYYVNGDTLKPQKFNPVTKSLEPFKDFKEACEYNSIQPDKLTFANVKKNIEKAEKLGDKLKRQMEEYRTELKKTSYYFLDSESLIHSSRVTECIYRK